MKKLILIGAGRSGRFTRYLAEACGFIVIGFLDDTKNAGETVDGIKILGNTENGFKQYLDSDTQFSICISYMPKKTQLYDDLVSIQAPLATLVHPTVVTLGNVSIGQGVTIQPYTVIQTGAIIEDNVLIEEQCSIGVDVTVSKHSVLTPNVVLTGGSKVEQKCFIGSNSVVNPEVIIAEGTTIGSGASVIKNTKVGTVCAGVPAKELNSK